MAPVPVVPRSFRSATNTTPSLRTARWRAAPRSSAISIAQNPAGSVMSRSASSHDGALAEPPGPASAQAAEREQRQQAERQTATRARGGEEFRSHPSRWQGYGREK